MRALPQPFEPTMPVLEKLSEIPDQPHDYGGEFDTWSSDGPATHWESPGHQGRICAICGHYSDCELCVDIYANNVNCLRYQADERNEAKLDEYKKAMEIYEHQLLYYVELKEKWGYR